MTSVELAPGNLDWSQLEGITLEGGYQVAELLYADGSTARFRIRVLGEYQRKACAHFYHVSKPDAQEQLQLWERAREFRHPGLSAPLAAGRFSLPGREVVYAVLERADEALSGVLQKRALESEETDEILRTVAQALDELHGCGFVHGCVSPDEVFAFGSSIKLSAAGIRRIDSMPFLQVSPPKYVAPESTGENITPAADVWCLGATVFEALTQKRYVPGPGGDFDSLAEPWKRIVQKCVEPDTVQRARITDLDRLREGEPVLKIAEVATPGALVAEPAADSTAIEQELSHLRRQRSIAPMERAFHGSRSWIYAAATLVLVALLLWAARPKHKATVVGPSPPPQTAPVGQTRSWPTKTVAPDTTTAVSRPNRPPEARTAEVRKTTVASAQNPAIWRVVLYTFSREEDAQKRAQTINQKHPGLGARTFSPSGKNRLYLVVAGGPTTRDEAARLRQEAVREGMPGDSYIQNYKE
jgi:serine/threonine protein kinase